MRTILNFTLAILLLVAFVGSGAFFVIVSQDLKLERANENATSSTSQNAATTVEEQLAPTP